MFEAISRVKRGKGGASRKAQHVQNFFDICYVHAARKHAERLATGSEGDLNGSASARGNGAGEGVGAGETAGGEGGGVGDSLFAALRLMTPSLDRERGSYGVREAALGRCVAEAIGLARGSDEARLLEDWQKGGRGHVGENAGDFVKVAMEVSARSRETLVGGNEVLGQQCSCMAYTQAHAKGPSRLARLIYFLPPPHSGLPSPPLLLASRRGFSPSSPPARVWGARVQVLKKRQQELRGDLTIAGVNALLDDLAAAGPREAKVAVVDRMRNATNPTQIKWILLIILQGLHFGMSDKSVLRAFHPDAEEVFNHTCDLRRLCHSLPSRSVRAKRQDIEPGSAVRPQLARRVDTAEAAWSLMKGKEAVVECKFDGDRVQIHKNGTAINFFSRNFKEHPEFLSGMEDLVIENILTDKCILDGEMLAWDRKNNRFVEFGSNQTAAKEAREGSNSDIQLCYVAFDILYHRDGSVIHYPLKRRHELLREVVRFKPHRFELLLPPDPRSSNISPRTPGEPNWSQYAHSAADIQAFFVQTVDNRDEGVVVKDLQSPWEAGDRSSKWLKLKPDYMDTGADIDALVMGAYFGSNRRGGELSQFLLGLWEHPPDPDQPPPRLMSFCRVGGGMSDDDLVDLRERLLPVLQLNERGQPPSKLYAVTNHAKERPDVWVSDPTRSVVLQIRGDIRVIRTEVFQAPRSLRFPRVTRVRHDKLWWDSLDLPGQQGAGEKGGERGGRDGAEIGGHNHRVVHDCLSQPLVLCNTPPFPCRPPSLCPCVLCPHPPEWQRIVQEREEQRSRALKDREAAKGAGGKGRGRGKGKGKGARRKRAVEVPAFMKPGGGAAGQAVGQSGSAELFFSGCTFYVVSAPPGMQQSTVQQVVRHGGVVSANLSRTVTHTVAHSASGGFRLKAAVNAGDVLTYEWLKECLQARKLIPPKSKHYVHRSPSTVQRQQQQMDKYGDSYTDDIADAVELKQLFAKVSEAAVKAVPSGDLAVQRRKLCVESGAVHTSIFQGVVLFVLPCLPALHHQHSWAEWQHVSEVMAGRRAALEVAMGGGTVETRLSTHVTHLLLPSCLAFIQHADVEATVRQYEESLTAWQLALVSRALSVHAQSKPVPPLPPTQGEAAAAALPHPRVSAQQHPAHVPRIVTVACVEKRLEGQGEEGPWEGFGGPSCPAFLESSDSDGEETGKDEDEGSSTDSDGTGDAGAPAEADADGSDGTGEEEEEEEETTDDEGDGLVVGGVQEPRWEGVGAATQQLEDEMSVCEKSMGTTDNGISGVSGMQTHAHVTPARNVSEPGTSGVAEAPSSECKEQEQHASKRLCGEERHGVSELIEVLGDTDQGSRGVRDELKEGSLEKMGKDLMEMSGKGESEEAGNRGDAENGSGKVEEQKTREVDSEKGDVDDRTNELFDFFFS
ncbi:unnamed protein product [Closterium sp. NIES-53]